VPDSAARCLAPGPPDRAQLWEHAGLIRSAAGLEQLRAAAHPLTRLIAECALARTESRGVHFRADHPVASDELAGHFVVHPGASPELERWS
jgi:aspartate oxidase